MPICRKCGEEVDELTVAVVDGKKQKLCEDCAETVAETENLAKESEAVVQQMMGFTGRR
jgi:protein-arginine kinase activator protein McsA